MSKSASRFARLLTDGIYRIKDCEPGKSIDKIQDDLGYALGREGGSAIAYWRKGRGHIPSDQADVEQLAREIVRRSDLDIEWLEQFLDSAGFPYPRGLCDELFPPPPPSHIPRRLYRKLIGRDEVVSDVIDALRDPKGKWIVGIDGMGGIGKTALVREIVDRCLDKRDFDDVLWVSILEREPHGEEYGADDVSAFGRTVDAVAHQLGVADTPGLPIEERSVGVPKLRPRCRTLIVLDNLEAATEPQNEIIGDLRPLLQPNKALLVSRHRFGGDVYRIHLTGLDEGPALEFIGQEAKERRIRRVESASPDELAEVVKYTYGSPLAMKLVIGQLDSLSLDTALDGLRQGWEQKSETEEDEYAQLYRSVYFSSWRLLSAIGRKLLLAMTFFEPGLGGTPEAIEATSHLSGGELTNHIRELWQLSFLETAEAQDPSLRQLRYCLHPLTINFVIAEMIETENSDETIRFWDQCSLSFTKFFVTYLLDHTDDYSALEAELGNIDRALTLAHLERMPRAVLLGGCEFTFFLASRGLWTVAEHHLSHARQAASTLGDNQAASATARLLGSVSRMRGKFVQAKSHFLEALALARASDDQERVSDLLQHLGGVAFELGAYREAETYWLEGLTIAEEIGYHPGAVSILRSLGSLALTRTSHAESEDFLRQALVRGRELGDPTSISATLCALGALAIYTGDNTQADTYLKESLALARAAGDVRATITALANLAVVRFRGGDYALAQDCLTEQLSLARQIGDIDRESNALVKLGGVARACGDYETAGELLSEALALAEEAGTTDNLMDALTELGKLSFDRGDDLQAEQYFVEVLDLSRALDRPDRIADSLSHLSHIALIQREYAQAGEYIEEYTGLARQVGSHWLMSAALNMRGELCLEQQALQTASECFREAVRLAQEIGARQHLADALYGLSWAVAGEDGNDDALCWAQKALSIYEDLGDCRASAVEEWLTYLLARGSVHHQANPT